MNKLSAMKVVHTMKMMKKVQACGNLSMMGLTTPSTQLSSVITVNSVKKESPLGARIGEQVAKSDMHGRSLSTALRMAPEWGIFYSSRDIPRVRESRSVVKP